MSRNVRLYISGIILFISIFLLNIGSEANGMLASKQQDINPPLLLKSSLTEVTEAEVRVIFWFEGESDVSRSSFLSEQILSQAGWKWETHGLTQAMTVSGYRHIDASEEDEIWTWFKTRAKRVELEGGKAYFDERAQVGIDGKTYLSQNSFEPKQEAISGTTSSIAGWQEGFFPEVKAGQDSVNIQLLTRSTSQGAITVLAVPVLLEEF